MPQIRLCDTSEFESKELQSVIWLDHTHLPWIDSTQAQPDDASRISERHHQAEGPYVLVQDITSGYFKRHLSQKFGKMKTEVEINRIEDAPEIVVASCVLHDMFLIAGDDVDEFLEDGYDGDDDDDDDTVGDDEFLPETEGSDKRKNPIMWSLPWTVNVYWKESKMNC